jgi:hypothetical protein
MVCIPGIAVTAIFTAIILLDLYKRDWRRVPGHALFGIFATLLVLFLCERTSEGVAWTLILAPFLFSILGYLIHNLVLFLYGRPSDTRRESEHNRDEYPGCPCCESRPCRCLAPCRERRPPPPPVMPNPTPEICPGPPPPPPTPVCPQPSGSPTCIKPSLAN